MIKYAIENGYEKYNFYGITGEFSEDSKMFGLFDFKRGFGAEYIGVMIVPMRKKERYDYYQRELERFRHTTAVFAVSDYYAIELMHFLNENGFVVPGDMGYAFNL